MSDPVADFLAREQDLMNEIDGGSATNVPPAAPAQNGKDKISRKKTRIFQFSRTGQNWINSMKWNDVTHRWNLACLRFRKRDKSSFWKDSWKNTKIRSHQDQKFHENAHCSCFFSTVFCFYKFLGDLEEKVKSIFSAADDFDDFTSVDDSTAAAPTVTEPAGGNQEPSFESKSLGFIRNKSFLKKKIWKNL